MNSGGLTWMDGMIYLGSILMVYNIARYAGFIRRMSWMRDGRRNTLALFSPMILLVLFLAGYLAVGLFGDPDWIVAGILLGGSIFVLIILSILYFIVDRVADHEKLQHALREAEHASEAKTTFLSNMSHDIRTPLNAILGYAQLAEREGVTDGERLEFVRKIRSSGQHLLALINDVLEMSRIESGRFDLAEEVTNLCDVFGEVRDMFAAQMEQKEITFTVEPRNMRDHIVICDRNRLNRILLNLISNAFKFTPEGGTVAVTMEQTGRANGRGQYELRVKDTGIGMSPEFAEKVFDAFERERTSTVSGIQGTGLGMAITKSIVDRMGGAISVDTAPGRGTEFLVKLAFAVPEETEGMPAGCARTPERRIDFGGRRVLLAEDNPVNREIAVMILTGAGLEVETAENGRIALEMVAASEPGFYDAVLMDVQMPEMNGYEATARIRGLADPLLARIPVVAMTANAFREDIENEKKAGMDAHISKPLDVPEMLATLESVLRGGAAVHAVDEQLAPD